MIKFALAGNPNCGKTTLFNSLTGSTAHVGNWPGVTVERREGAYKKCAEPISIVDLPGIYSLSPYTPEEIVSRQFILDSSPDCVINIVDSTNLERNLYLTTQLMEIDVPIVIALNMMDSLEKSGDTIDAKGLEAKIGLPVIEISALKENGLKELMTRAYEASKLPRLGVGVFEGSPIESIINDVKTALDTAKTPNPMFHAVKLVEMDELETKEHPSIAKMVEAFKTTFSDATFGTDFEAIIADGRYRYIEQNYTAFYTRKNANKMKSTKSDKIDKVLTHKIWGIPLFLVIMFTIFHLVFSENFLFLGAAFGKDFTTLAGTPVEGVFGVGGINSIGVILQRLMSTLTDLIGGGLESALANAPTWVSGLVVSGIWGGLSTVLSFMPQILLLLLLFAILEDSGYMARVAFILDRVLRRFGLSGRAFMPMIMGFGCSIPAMINTRTLADENERTATLRVIPFFSCGAKLPILTAIAGGIVLQFGIGNADLITYSMYLLGILTALISIILMRATTLKGATAPFIMELPPYHAPQFKNLMLLLWDKAKHFIKKAFTIILASTIVIWLISHFNFSWQYLEDSAMNQSILAGVGQLIQPLFTPLGFGSQLGEWGWVFVVSTITGLIAKENVIATFGTLAACIIAGFNNSADGLQAVAVMIAATGITVPALIAFIAFNMTTIPCVAAVATARAELPKNKFRGTLLFWLATSYVVSASIYVIGSWWWTLFIFASVAAVAAICIVLFNKRRALRPAKVKDTKGDTKKSDIENTGAANSNTSNADIANTDNTSNTIENTNTSNTKKTKSCRNDCSSCDGCCGKIRKKD